MSSVRNVEYHVEVSSRAESDLAALYDEINANYSDAAYRWYNSGRHEPNKVAKPRHTTREDRKFRQLLYGNKPHIYRVIYSAIRAPTRS